MFKRANKITALLVAAASIMSVVPAMASERLGTKDGTIENAIAFKDGKYIYEGYKSDDEDKSIYYNNGSKDKQLEDIEDSDIQGIYGDKYAFLNDNGDEYLVDLSSGSVSDDETPTDKQENLETKLESKLKKTDRYDTGTTIAANTIGGAKFAGQWYEYAATGMTGDAVADGDLVGGKLFGYSDEAGNYIDATRVANIYTYSYAKKKVVKVENFNDKNDDAGLKVTLNNQPEVLTQDKDYIYSLVDVTVTTDASAAGVGGTHTEKYLQKISKAQGDKKDGAYIPKSVDSYMLDNKTLYDNGDASDAYKAMLTADDGYAVADNIYRVVDGVLYVTRVKGDKVKIFKIKMTKIKENAVDADIKAAAGKLDGYVLKKDGDTDQDLPNASAVSIDVDGNTWAINEGKIYKFTGTDKKEVYTCDRSLDRLSVYDEKSLIAWEDGEDVYTTVGEGKAVTETEAPAATPAKVGWDKLADGTWNFYDATGAKVVNNWANVGGVWYFLKADGAMATGWLNQNGTWYYLNASGAMATGWLNDNGTWYYLNASGAMLANTTVDGYVLGASGAWVK
ncbi:N-acetylmuramoyl-L-alanine amidase family protein [Clostridium chromiireducens]|uniref:N-acetylmuramoyl-L-alanine amidase family protein n=1 Tax=Clostridium chromiireducens TaxID=225345 RepID=A0A399IU74_9CLOT|nr:N-acetylmuramoyl-L-alanine amidase family protein [Clostridium chromiireducens]RII36665.1 N-acetylmuramoyl-L-alanine amidase family protein [Clostridium chromiireducens]